MFGFCKWLGVEVWCRGVCGDLDMEWVVGKRGSCRFGRFGEKGLFGVFVFCLFFCFCVLWLLCCVRLCVLMSRLWFVFSF